MPSIRTQPLRLATARALSVLGAAVALTVPAEAGDNVYWSVGVAPAPGVAVGVSNLSPVTYTPPPVVYTAPRVVYAAPAVLVQPVPVYVQPSGHPVHPVHPGRGHGKGHGKGHGHAKGQGYGHDHGHRHGHWYGG